jgi:hypothetical protein
MRARLYSALLFVLGLFTQALLAQEHLVLGINESEAIIAQPGQIITTTLRVSNLDLEEGEFVMQNRLPERWRTITDDFSFFIAKGRSDIRILSLHIPALTPAGDYVVRCRVSSRPFPEISDTREILVRVQKVARMELELLHLPEYAFAGDTVRAVFRLINKSNQEQWIALSCFNVTLAGDSLVKVHAGAVMAVETACTVPSNLAEAVSYTLALSARFYDEQGPALQQSARLTLLPRKAGRRHDFTLPGEARLYYYDYRKGDLHRGGLQGDLAFRGFLDRKRKHQLDLRMRGPDQYRISTLGQHDEYYAAYIHSDFSVEAGDQAFSLSTLTEMYKYGRGMQGRFTRDRFSAGAFYLNSRFYFPAFSEYAAYLQYHLSGSSSVRFNYLNKHKESERKADLVSLEAEFRPRKNSAIEVETALGRTAGRFSAAGRLALRSTIRRLFLNGYYIKAGENFPGYYKNTDMANLNLNLNLGKALALDCSFHQDYQNADLDTTIYSAPYNRTSQFGLVYHPRSGSTIRLYYYDRFQKDRMPVPRFDYGQQSLRLQGEQAWSRFTLSLTGEKGVSQNHLGGYTGDDQEMFYVMAAAMLKLRQGDEIGGYISYSNNNRYNGERNRDVLAGLNGSWSLYRNARLNLSWRSGYSIEEYYLDRNIFEAGFSQGFSGGKLIDLRARYTLLRNSLDRRELAAVASARLPFNLPLPVKKVTGSLHGRIIDLDGHSCEGLILHLGDRTSASGTDGSFHFAGVDPGNYPLIIDPRSIGLHRVILEKIPAVTITAGGEAALTLTLCKAAELNGRLRAPAVLSRNTAPDLSLLIVELNDGQDALRVYCDREGRFRLPDLKPGSYTITIYDHMLEGYEVKQKQQHLVLAPGENRQLDFSVAEKVRTIVFQKSWKNAAE